VIDASILYSIYFDIFMTLMDLNFYEKPRNYETLDTQNSYSKAERTPA